MGLVNGPGGGPIEAPPPLSPPPFHRPSLLYKEGTALPPLTSSHRPGKEGGVKRGRGRGREEERETEKGSREVLFQAGEREGNRVKKDRTARRRRGKLAGREAEEELSFS